MFGTLVLMFGILGLGITVIAAAVQGGKAAWAKKPTTTWGLIGLGAVVFGLIVIVGIQIIKDDETKALERQGAEGAQQTILDGYKGLLRWLNDSGSSTTGSPASSAAPATSGSTSAAPGSSSSAPTGSLPAIVPPPAPPVSSGTGTPGALYRGVPLDPSAARPIVLASTRR